MNLGFGHPEYVGNGAAGGRATMASQALRGKVAAELEIAFLRQALRRTSTVRPAGIAHDTVATA